MGLLSSLSPQLAKAWPGARPAPQTADRPTSTSNTGGATAADDPDVDGPSKAKSAPAVPAPPGSPGESIKPMPVMSVTASQGVETTKDGARQIAVKVEPKDLKSRLD